MSVEINSHIVSRNQFTHLIVRNGGTTRPEDYFLSPVIPRRGEIAQPVLTKAFLQASSEAPMLFAPFGCTHPPPPVTTLSAGAEPKSRAQGHC